MRNGEKSTGWIKLHRQTAEHGHFEMPAIALSPGFIAGAKPTPLTGNSMT